MEKFCWFKQKNKENRSKKASVSFFILGYNFERLINVLSQKGVKILLAKKEGVKNAEIEVSIFDEKKVEELLKSKNFQIVEKKYNGIARIFKFFKFRIGIFVGIFLFFCFYIVISNYTLKIEVIGNENVKKDEIISVLSENGVSIFSLMSSKENDEIEEIILKNFSQISLVSVVKKANSIIVNVKEKIISSEYENLENNGALLASEDGIITEIKLVQGTAVVKVGDSVKKGDVLVAPYVVDSSGNKISIEAKAKIKAEVWLSGQSVHEKKTVVKTRTGNFSVERKMSFLEKEILTEKQDVSFENFEIEEKTTYLSNSILPIVYSTITYYEVKEQEKEICFEEVKTKKIEEAKDVAKQKIFETDNIVYENYVLSEENEKTFVDYVICVERIVSN